MNRFKCGLSWIVAKELVFGHVSLILTLFASVEKCADAQLSSTRLRQVCNLNNIAQQSTSNNQNFEEIKKSTRIMSIKASVYLSMGMMILAGAFTTLVIKYQDIQCVRKCASESPSERETFKQPFWQTEQMFAGETGCWLVIALWSAFSRAKLFLETRTGNAGERFTTGTGDSDSNREPLAQNFSNPGASNAEPTELFPLRLEQTAPLPSLYILVLPAMCDILSTTLLNVGLLFVVPSLFQMTRGIVALFSCLFSVWFLKRRVEMHRWFGLCLVVLGIALAGYAGTASQGLAQPGVRTLGSAGSIYEAVSGNGASVRRTWLGILVISVAQIFAAGQFVIEEAVMSRYSIKPLELVGWEGIAGLTVILFSQLIAQVIYGSTDAGRGSFLDMGQGWWEISHHKAVWTAGLLIMFSTGVFNYFALTVTRSVSATSRCTTDSFRTLLIWIVSLSLGWESFHFLQLIGFMGLVYGNLLFNEVIRPPALDAHRLREKFTLIRCY